MAELHLIDGTYELFRAFYSAPSKLIGDQEVGATLGLFRSLRSLLKQGATHLIVAFDTEIESFRNQLFLGYKTGDGIDPALKSQFPLAERMTRAMGLTTLSMLEFEADDALATCSRKFRDEFDRVLICTPDKDLAQCVVKTKVVMFDRKNKIVLGEDEVTAKYGVPPESIPDWLALVGDTADGIPGIPRWGERSAAAVLRVYPHIEDIPRDIKEWKTNVRGAEVLSQKLNAEREAALLYRTLATLRFDVPLDEVTKESCAWKHPNPDLSALADYTGSELEMSLT